MEIQRTLTKTEISSSQFTELFMVKYATVRERLIGSPEEGKMDPAILHVRDGLPCLSVKNLLLISMPKYWPGIFKQLLWFGA